MASENDVEIRVRVDAEGAISGLNKTGAALGSLQQQSERGSAGISRFQGSVIALNQGIQLAGRGIAIVERLGKAFSDFVERGDKLNDLTQGFKAFGGTASMLEGARKGVNGLATDVQILSVANRALLADIPGIKDNFGALVEATTKLAEATAQEVVPSLDAMTLALTTGSDRSLRLLRINIDETKAEKEFAAAVGITAEKLNEEGKLEARRIAIQDQLIAKSKEIPAAEKGVGDALLTVQNAATDLINKLAGGADDNSNLAGAIGQVGKALQEIDATWALSQIKSIGDVAADTIRGLSLVPKFLGNLAESYPKSLAEGGTLATGGSLHTAAIKTLEQLITGNKDLASVLKNVSTPAVAAAGEALGGKLADGTGKATTAMGRFKASLKDPSQYIKETKKSAAELAAEMDKVAEAEAKVSKYARDYHSVAITGPLGAALDNMFGTGLTQREQELRDAGYDVGTTLGEGMAASADSVIANLAEALTSSASKEEKFKAVGATIGGAIGAWFGVGQIGALIGEQFGGTISQIGNSTKDSIGAITKIASIMFAGVTGGLSIAFRKSINDALVKAFAGGRNEEQQARKQINKWWKELFKDKPDVKLEIDGQIKAVRDLFEHETEKSVYNSGKGGKFGGIGNAFKGLLGMEELDGAQLNNILEENIGNLNNLQLMLQAAEIDSEDFGKALEKAYLTGQLTAEQFLQASRDINDVYAKGIPGAIGATGQAFENFTSGALTSGQIARDALIDMAAEAQETNITSMDGLAQSMIAQGASAEEVTKLMQVLADQGITTLEQLANVNSTQAAQITIAAEKIGIALDDPVQKLEAIQKQLENLDGAEANVTVNVKVNDPDNVLPKLSGSGSGSTGGKSGGWMSVGEATSGGVSWSGGKIIAGTSDENWNSYTSDSGGDSGSGGGGGDYSSGSSSSAASKKKRTVNDIVELFKAGKIGAAKAAELIGRLNASEGTGLPGLGNVKGALKQMLKGKHSMKGFAGLKNLFGEMDEGGMELGEGLLYLQTLGYDTKKLTKQLGGRDINTIDAALRIDDSELIRILDIINHGANLNLNLGGKKQPGAGKGRRPGKKARLQRAARSAAL